MHPSRNANCSPVHLTLEVFFMWHIRRRRSDHEFYVDLQHSTRSLVFQPNLQGNGPSVPRTCDPTARCIFKDIFMITHRCLPSAWNDKMFASSQSRILIQCFHRLSCSAPLGAGGGLFGRLKRNWIPGFKRDPHSFHWKLLNMQEHRRRVCLGFLLFMRESRAHEPLRSSRPLILIY